MKDGNAPGPANRDGEGTTRTLTTIVTPTQVNHKAHRPTASTRQSTRRRPETSYRARGHHNAKYSQHHPLTSEHHRRHLTSPRSTERLPQSYGDQRSHSRAQRVLDDPNATLLRRDERRRHDDERRRREDQALDQARATARKASRAMDRARQAVALSATLTPARATPSPARPLGVASQETRPGDDAFMSGSV